MRLLLCISAAALPACDLCTLSTAVEARDGRTGLSLGILQDYGHAGRLVEAGNLRRNSEDQHINTSSTKLVASYRFTESVGLRLNLPYVVKSWQRREPSGLDRGSDSGLGDTLVELTGTPVRLMASWGTLVVACFAGVEMPTGNSSRLQEESTVAPPAPRPIPYPGATIGIRHVPVAGGGTANVIHGHQLTLGSGSWDVVAGVQMRVSTDRFYFTLYSYGHLNGSGTHDYRFGPMVAWGAGPGAYLVFDDQGTLGLTANCSGQASRRDTVHGEKLAHSGGTYVYVGPSLTGTWSNRLSGELGLDLPVVQKTNGTQIVDTWRMHGGLTWRL
ncbi:hypothetical protein LBMAG53_29240 [Planctomycetota bacterium]|nr:hypothetical protein LBMAG53_29240 [Planctomycetota bacterium]